MCTRDTELWSQLGWGKSGQHYWCCRLIAPKRTAGLGQHTQLQGQVKRGTSFPAVWTQSQYGIKKMPVTLLIPSGTVICFRLESQWGKSGSFNMSSDIIFSFSEYNHIAPTPQSSILARVEVHSQYLEMKLMMITDASDKRVGDPLHTSRFPSFSSNLLLFTSSGQCGNEHLTGQHLSPIGSAKALLVKSFLSNSWIPEILKVDV